MTQCGADGMRMEANHEENSISHLTREFDHARARREQIQERRAAVAQADRRRTEPHLFSSKQPTHIADRGTHESDARARLPDAPG